MDLVTERKRKATSNAFIGLKSMTFFFLHICSLSFLKMASERCWILFHRLPKIFNTHNYLITTEKLIASEHMHAWYTIPVQPYLDFGLDTYVAAA